MVYIRRGSEGVQEFRDSRLTQLPRGEQDAFYDRTHLKEEVLDALAKIEREANSSAISALFVLLEAMFTEYPKDRPDAKKVESHPRMQSLAGTYPGYARCYHEASK